MTDFQYAYKKLWGNQSQCELCNHATCPDKGTHSMFDGVKHLCNRFATTEEERKAVDKHIIDIRRKEAYERYTNKW